MKILCPICRSSNVNSLHSCNLYNYCHSCQVAWLKKRIQPVYKTNYYQGKLSWAKGMFAPLQNFFYRQRIGYINLKNIKTWIDIGAGDGEFLQHISSDKKIGVEISESGRKMMEQSGILAMSPSQFLEKSSLGASVISFWHVLEHVDQPERYLNAARNNLLKTGKLVIGVPNISSLEFKIFGKNWFHFVPEYHCWCFSTQSLPLLVKKCGFTIEKTDFWEIEHNLSSILQSFINYTSQTHNILHQLIKRQVGLGKIGFREIFWVIFWLTLGLPVVALFWMLSSSLHLSGALVVIASPKITSH